MQVDWWWIPLSWVILFFTLLGSIGVLIAVAMIRQGLRQQRETQSKLDAFTEYRNSQKQRGD